MIEKKTFLSLVLLASFYLFFRFILIMKVPPLWPDESIYAEIAYNILHYARSGADLWGDAIPGVKDHILGYPPLFIYSLAFWFKLNVFTIFSQRFLSIIVGLVYLFSYFYLAKTFLNKKNNYELIFIPLLILVFDPTFLRTSIISRPEIFVLLFANISLISFNHVFLKQSKKRIGRKDLFFSVLAGLTASIATLFHLLGIIYLISEAILLIFIKRTKICKDKLSLLFLASSLIPLIMFTFTLIPYLDNYKNQIGTISQMRATSPSWIRQIFTYAPTEERTFAILLIISGIFPLLFGKIYQNRRLMLITLIIAMSWIIVLVGKIQWYYILPIPFTYMGIALMIDSENKKSSLFRKMLVLVLFFFLLLNLKSIFSLRYLFYKDVYSYEELSTQILNYIPDNKTVFLSSIPDAYYVFKTKRNNRLYQFPPVPIAPEKFLNLLDQSDYIIYNASLSVSGLDLYLQKYVLKNMAKANKIESINQYQVVIFELKPGQERKRVE